jgi:hypothetical protein
MQNKELALIKEEESDCIIKDQPFSAQDRQQFQEKMKKRENLVMVEAAAYRRMQSYNPRASMWDRFLSFFGFEESVPKEFMLDFGTLSMLLQKRGMNGTKLDQDTARIVTNFVLPKGQGLALVKQGSLIDISNKFPAGFFIKWCDNKSGLSGALAIIAAMTNVKAVDNQRKFFHERGIDSYVNLFKEIKKIKDLEFWLETNQLRLWSSTDESKVTPAGKPILRYMLEHFKKDKTFTRHQNLLPVRECFLDIKQSGMKSGLMRNSYGNLANDYEFDKDSYYNDELGLLDDIEQSKMD